MSNLVSVQCLPLFEHLALTNLTKNPLVSICEISEVDIDAISVLLIDGEQVKRQDASQNSLYIKINETNTKTHICHLLEQGLGSRDRKITDVN